MAEENKGIDWSKDNLADALGRPDLRSALQKFENEIKQDLLGIKDINTVYVISKIESFVNDFFSWHTSKLQAFIEAEILHLEGMKLGSQEKSRTFFVGMAAGVRMDTYNQAIDDQITHYQELLLTLKS